MSQEVYDFVFVQRQVENKLCALNIPEVCNMPTCGADVAIVRGEQGGLEVRILELNARATMVSWVYS